MTDEVLSSYTRQYITAAQTFSNRNSPAGGEVVFAWQGGEPTLMGLDFFRQAVALQRQYLQPGQRIQNTLQTNGTLLDDDWCRFLRQHGFLVGLSLDGPRDLHDAYRVDKGGRPTFDRVMQAVGLLKQHQVEFNILACVSDRTVAEPMAVYHFLRDEVGAHFIQFIPIVEQVGTAGSRSNSAGVPLASSGEQRVSLRSVRGRDYGKFLIEIFDEWVRKDVGQVYVQIFDVALAAWAGQRPGLCIFEETCGRALALEHNGDLYACDHFVDPAHFRGNILASPLAGLAVQDSQRRFGLDKRDKLPRYCRECPVRFICNGGCPKDRLLATPAGEPGLNYLCEGYKAFFTHIDLPMRAMARLLAQRRAPAEIMAMLPPLARKRHRT